MQESRRSRPRAAPDSISLRALASLAVFGCLYVARPSLRLRLGLGHFEFDYVVNRVSRSHYELQDGGNGNDKVQGNHASDGSNDHHGIAAPHEP